MEKVFLVIHDTDDTHQEILKVFKTKEAADNYIETLLKREYQNYLTYYPTYEDFYSDYHYYYHVDDWDVSQ